MNDTKGGDRADSPPKILKSSEKGRVNLNCPQKGRRPIRNLPKGGTKDINVAGKSLLPKRGT